MENMKIKDVVITNAYSIGKKDNFDFINYLDTGNLTEGRIDEIKYINIKEEKAPSRAKRIVKSNDILISTVRPNQKHYGIIKNPIENLIVSTGFAVLTPNEKLVDPDYLYKYLTLTKNTKYLQAIAESSTTTYPSIKPSVIENIEINLPSLKAQKKIGNILTTLDDKIELNNQMNQTLEEMAQAIFNEWFVEFNFPNEDGEPYKDNGGKMVDSELGEIPEGWRVGIFKDILNISSGKRPNKKSKDKNEDFKIPVIGAGGAMAYTKESNVNKNVLVIGRVGTLGVVQRINKKSWLSDNTLVIDSDYHEYSYQNLKMVNYTSINRGSTQPLITQGDMKVQNIIIPLKDVLYKYEILAGSLFSKIQDIIEQNETLIKTRDTLLPKLMSGEIRV